MRTKWTKEAIINYIEEQGYIFIQFIKFDKSNSRILIKCNNSNHNPYEVKFDNFKQGKRCPTCKKEKLSETFRKDYSIIEKEINDRGYEIVEIVGGKYINVDTVFILKCKNGHLWKTTYRNFEHPNDCSYCNGNGILSYEYVKEYFQYYGYTLLSKEYINASKLLEVKCPEGHIFYITYNKFQQRRRCPICNESKGEREIRRVLESHNVLFEPQKEFEGLYGINKNKKTSLLSYDFYLPSYNLLIEFQGEYHDGTARNQTEEGFKKQQKHDKKKKEYAKNNNIDLLEIWYWDFNNIENILIEKLSL